jgi:hypothetical protein
MLEMCRPESWKCRGPELQVAALVVKGEPGDVNLARRLEDPCTKIKVK